MYKGRGVEDSCFIDLDITWQRLQALFLPSVLSEFGARLAPFIAESSDDLKSPPISHSDYRRFLY